MKPVFWRVVFWVLLVAALVSLYRWFFPPEPPPVLIDYTRLLEDVRAGKIASVTLPRAAMYEAESALPGPDGKRVRFLTASPPYRELLDELNRRGVAVKVEPVRPLRRGRFPWLAVTLLIAAGIIRRRRAWLSREISPRP